MASSFFNLGSIIGGVAFGWWLDPHFGARSLIGLAIRNSDRRNLAVVLAISFAAARRVQVSRDFHWRDQGVRTVLMLMVRQ